MFVYSKQDCNTRDPLTVETPSALCYITNAVLIKVSYSFRTICMYICDTIRKFV